MKTRSEQLFPPTRLDREVKRLEEEKARLERDKKLLVNADAQPPKRWRNASKAV
jgi:hypothetical protein